MIDIGFVSSLDVIAIGKYFQSIIEKDLKMCREQSKKLGNEINDITYIVDMDQFSIRQLLFSGVLEIGLDYIQMLQDYYPEIWSRILVINAPVYYQTIFNFFKPILGLHFLQKIYVASSENSTSLLLKYIDPEVIPAFLGGKRVDSYGNRMCYEFMNFGGTLPEEYYARNRAQLLPTDPGVKDVWVPPRSYYNHPFVCQEPDSIIRVEIRTEGGSIGASIVYKEFDIDPENLDLPSPHEYIDVYSEENSWKRISPFAHIQGHISPVNNYFTAPWPGIYVYRFDNTYNWLTSRRLICRIRILPPGTTPQYQHINSLNVPF